MIISASRRTDLPAFFASWFMNRIEAEYVLAVNPFNPRQIRRISLDPEEVEAIVFWTRDPANLVPRLDELDQRGFFYYFLFTITGLPRELEPQAPDYSSACQAFLDLSSRLGPDRVIWRFDPILITDVSDENQQLESFKKIAGRLSGATRRVIISFADIYKKVRQNLAALEKETGLGFFDINQAPERIRRLAAELALIAKHYGLELQSCCEKVKLDDVGVNPGKCVDDLLLESVFGLQLELPKDRHQRKLCRCVKSVDIGHYDTCLHGCVYCYATQNLEAARRNVKRHDPGSPFLIDPVG